MGGKKGDTRSLDYNCDDLTWPSPLQVVDAIR